MTKYNLPSPESYYLYRLKKLKVKGNQIMALCPFHSDTKASLSIDLERGMFNCFACRSSGGSIIDFEMKFYGLSFKEALNSIFYKLKYS